MNAFDRWYKGLSSFNRDLVLQHFCAEAPVPLGELASQHALLRETARQCRNFLMDEFNRSVEGDLILRAWIEHAELDLRKPCLVSTFLDRHAWLGENIGDTLTVLRLFTGMRWLDATTSASPTGQWIFMDDLKECGAATVRALDLDVDEVMSLSTASALLDARQVPVPSDLDTLRQWLIHCGLDCKGNQISLTRSKPQPTETAVVFRGLSELVEQLSALLLVNKDGESIITLGDLLGEAETADGELGVVSRMLRDATFTAGEGWVVPDRSTDSERRRAVRGEGTSAEQNATEGNSPSSAAEEVKNREAESDGSIPLAGTLADAGEAGLEASPGDLIAQLLEGCAEGMSTSLIEGALDGVVPQGEVTEALFTDARFAITARGAWCLQNGSDSTAPSAAAIPAQGLFSREEASASTTEAASGVGSRGGLQRERERLDKVEAALREADTPLTVEELKERTGVAIGIQYLRQQIEGDARFSRSQRNQWALTEWHLPVYKPIKELISDMVDAHGGQVEADKVVALLRRDFDIKESSLRAAMSIAPFTARGGMVRRIAEDLDTGSEEAAVPAARTAQTDPSAEQQPHPVDEAPDVDDLMNHLGLI
ncbi:hypothetical protein C6N75_06285 [Streptomyces solincola]|uniref:Uncharacterized protein n=1 Tax=Streptomyces solincola TaxID=2100817 RepID=A0A2S9Q005_9ACTN|nr:hypothetical protein [Streptomyces solincola]PRH80015.1 hypothetical protein C6N75_06285 [Streptomyces solincola]